MSSDWIPLPLDTKWFTNVDETALTRAFASLENGYCTEAGGLSRFPGLKLFKDLGGQEPVFLESFQHNDLMAVKSGRFYRLDRNANVEDVTGVPLSGGRRPVFAETERSLLAAAGGPIISFAGEKTKVLSPEAPNASHVGFIDNFVIAGEVNSNIWQYSAAGEYDTWDPLDSFAATGAPDNITALQVTPFRELLFGGPKSIEQYERLPSGDPPFFRRWAVGEGILAPYTFTFGDNAAWAVNQAAELVRLSGQVSASASDDIGRTLSKVDNWDGAWAENMQLAGQKFILLVIPKATTPYGTKGLAVAYDYRQQKWCSLYGWDASLGVPARWPGWSYKELWGRKFVGGEGKIYEFSDDSRYNAGELSRFLVRTAHLAELGEIRIDALRMRFKRGTGSNSQASQISVRANRDNKGFGTWQRKSFGLRGEREMWVQFGGFGAASTWQFEVSATDDSPVELVKIEAQVTKLGF